MPPLKLSEKARSLLRDFMLLFDLEDSFKGSTEVTESDATKVLEYIKSVFEQAGLPGYDATNWFGIQAPKGISAELVRTLNEHFNRASNDPGLQKRYAEAGILPIRESVEVFQKRILDDHARWREVVRTAGIKSD